jgi:hypothetical protein
MDTPTPNQRPSVKERLRALLGAGMGSLVVATASLVPQAAEATPVRNAKHDDAQRPAISDRVRDIREQIKVEGTFQLNSAGEANQELLAWWNWGRWPNWHNWRNWFN